MIIRPAFISIDDDGPGVIQIVSKQRKPLEVTEIPVKTGFFLSTTNSETKVKVLFPGIQSVNLNNSFYRDDVKNSVFEIKQLELVKEFSFDYLINQRSAEPHYYITYDFCHIYSFIKVLEDLNPFYYREITYEALEKGTTKTYYKTLKNGIDHYVCFPKFIEYL